MSEVETSDLESAQSSEEPEVSTNDLPEAEEPETEEPEGAETEDQEEPEGEEPEPESEEPGEDAAAKPKKNTAQERIAELTRLRREAERERDAYRQTLERLAQGQTQKEPEQSQEPLKPPRRYDYSSDDEYDAALATYTEQRAAQIARQEVQQYQQQQKQTEAQRKRQEAIQQATKAEKEFASEAEDYFETIEAESPINDDAVREMLPAESVPKVLYHLHKHPEEAQRIADLPTTDQAVYEIGKLEASLNKPRRKETTNAPEKPRKVGGRGKTRKGWRDDMPMTEVMKQQGYRK